MPEIRPIEKVRRRLASTSSGPETLGSSSEPQDSNRDSPSDFGGGDEVALDDRHGRAAYHAGDARHRGEPDREDDQQRRGAEHRDHDQRRDDLRQGQDHVHRPHQHVVEPPRL